MKKESTGGIIFTCLFVVIAALVLISAATFYFFKTQEVNAQRVELVASLVAYFDEEASPLLTPFLDAVEVKHGKKVRKLVAKAIVVDIDKWQNEKFLKFVSEMP